MSFTKHNHINPCFWTALWNPSYYDDFINGKTGKRAREQKVYTLDFSIPKIIYTKVENVHYIKNLGLAPLNKEDSKFYGQFYNPDTKQNVNYNHITDEQHFVVDFENHFTGLEKIGGYDQLLKIAKNKRIDTEEERVLLSAFLALHQLRGIKFLYNLFAKYKNEPNHKMKALMHFKQIISQEDKIASIMLPLLNARWTLYVVDEFTFPLSDSPIIHHDKYVWAILSPMLLLEIEKGKKKNAIVNYQFGIEVGKFALIRKQIIFNTFQSIIFSEKETLEKWRKSETWKRRKMFLEIKS